MNLDKYTEISQNVLRNSLNIANSYSNQYVTCFHLLRAICDEKNSLIIGLFEKSGINLSDLKQNLNDTLFKKPKVNNATDIFLDNNLKKVLSMAESIAFKNGDTYVAIETLLTALISDDEIKAS